MKKRYKGIVYATDYSANFTNRSLVDKKYVEQMFNKTKHEIRKEKIENILKDAS